MNSTPPKPPNPIPPPRLQKGDTIGLLAPAGPIRDQESFAAGLRMLKELGYQVHHAPDILRDSGYLAGSDERRAQEFHQLWEDREIKALLAVRGGYGTLRLLKHLDFELCRRQPKILAGFSDISGLLNVIHCHTGLITFHGPNLCSLAKADKPSVEAFFNALNRRETPPIKAPKLEILQPGTAKGRLLGGNLTTLVHLLATANEPIWDNGLIFIEDVGEAPYRIDRMLTQLDLAGRLDKINGLILGSFNDCGDTEKIWERALELVGKRNIPVWANFPSGHTASNYMLPVGVEAAMDSNTGTLHFHGPATR